MSLLLLLLADVTAGAASTDVATVADFSDVIYVANFLNVCGWPLSQINF